jgi:hypothetical protein
MSMPDEKLDRLLSEAARDWRVPPAPPLDEMWARVEAAHFDAPRARRGPGTRWWAMLGTGIAAALLLGVGIGRWTAPQSDVRVASAEREVLSDDVPPPVTPGTSGPYARAATRYLDQTVALLATLPQGTRGARAELTAAQASELLTTTRLLLDSPVAANDPEMRDLLDDLELVLAQIARLSESRARRSELELINETIEQREVLPRLREVAAGISASE